jgi:hypothetical protein
MAAVRHGIAHPQDAGTKNRIKFWLVQIPPAAQTRSMNKDASAAALRFRQTGSDGADMPRAPVLQTLLAYWRSKCHADGRLPGRQDLDPLELRDLLPNIYLIDVLPEERFRIRLLGEAHVEVYGRGKVGKVIDDIFPPPVAAEFNRLYAAVVRRRVPVINRGQVTWMESHSWMHYEGLHAPLASDGVTIDCIFGAGAFTSDAG